MFRSALSLLIVAAITLLYRGIVTQVNHTTIALSYLMAILGIATRWGLFEAILASIASMLSFNFFFIPPTGTFMVVDPQNWVALFAFLVTAVVASQLSAGVKRRALEATRRRQEMERLYELSQSLMLLDKKSTAAAQVSRSIANVFDLSGVAIFDRRTDEICRAGLPETAISDGRMREIAEQNHPLHDFSAMVSVVPLRGTTEVMGSLAVASDSISQTALNAVGHLAAIVIEKARAEEAAALMEASRQNEAMRAMLLDALAHEFKTPLTSIKAAASSVLDEEPPAQKELVTIIEEETDRLDTLVTETIRMAQIETGEFQLDKHPQSVHQMVDEALKKLRILVEDREIDIDIDRDLPRIKADAELAGLALRQLITNALKYSDPESRIAIRAASIDPRFVRISVADSGPGIPAKEQARIFDRYYRGSNGRRIPGTGLGLAIARDIVRAHGGEIGVEMRPVRGSEFFFTLPRAE